MRPFQYFQSNADQLTLVYTLSAQRSRRTHNLSFFVTLPKTLNIDKINISLDASAVHAL